MRALLRDMIREAERLGLDRPRLERRSRHFFVVGLVGATEVRVGVAWGRRNFRSPHHFRRELRHAIERATGEREKV